MLHPKKVEKPVNHNPHRGAFGKVSSLVSITGD
jgi:hypothetical protein